MDDCTKNLENWNGAQGGSFKSIYKQVNAILAHSKTFSTSKHMSALCETHLVVPKPIVASVVSCIKQMGGGGKSGRFSHIKWREGIYIHMGMLTNKGLWGFKIAHFCGTDHVGGVVYQEISMRQKFSQSNDSLWKFLPRKFSFSKNFMMMSWRSWAHWAVDPVNQQIIDTLCRRNIKQTAHFFCRMRPMIKSHFITETVNGSLE